jgi:hypothetical protein
MPRKQYTTPEKVIQQQCLEWLTIKRIFHWRQNSGGFRNPKSGVYYRMSSAEGISDICGLMPGSGRFFAVEVKRQGNKPKEHQQAFLDRIHAEGGLAFVVTSVDELIQIIEQELNKKESI